MKSAAITEDEAKSRFCPLVREAFLEGHPFHGHPLCVGSACMAWRLAGTTDNPQGYCGMAGEP